MPPGITSLPRASMTREPGGGCTEQKAHTCDNHVSDAEGGLELAQTTLTGSKHKWTHLDVNKCIAYASV